MTKERSKISFLPFNMLYCIASFMVPFGLCSAFNIDMSVSLIISMYAYLTDVNNQTSNDYLKHCIDVLRENTEEQLKTKQDADI